MRSAKSCAVVGARDERAPERLARRRRSRDRREHVLQRAAARPPELVGVTVDDPVRAELGGREPRHARHPLALAQPLGRLADQMERHPRARTRSRISVVPSRELLSVAMTKSATGIQVERDLRVDDVCLVAREDGEDEPSSPQQLLRRAAQLPVDATRGRRSTVSRRCSSVSSRRCSRTTSASPSAATSTAYAASSTTVGRGNVSLFPSPSGRSASRRRVSIDQRAVVAGRARARRHRRRASRRAPRTRPSAISCAHAVVVRARGLSWPGCW